MRSFSLCPCNLAASLSCWTAEQVIHQKRNIINFSAALQSTYPLLFFLLPSDFDIKAERRWAEWNTWGSQNLNYCVSFLNPSMALLSEIAFLQILN